MRKGLVAILLTVLAVGGLGVGSASASASVSNTAGSMTGQRASSADPGYYGLLTAKTSSTACVVAEWKNAGGWVRYGFHQGQFELSELRVCYNNLDTSEEYRLHTSQVGHVFGLRFVNNVGLPAKVLCDDDLSGTANDCTNKLA